MHKEWKEELEQIRLTDRQKNNMKQAMHEKKRSTHRFVPVVLPAFMMMVLFVFWTIADPSTVNEHTGTQASTEEPSEMTVELFTFTLVTEILVGLAFGLSIIIVNKVPRLQRYSFWRFIAKLSTRKWLIVYIVALVVAILGIVWFVFNTSSPIPTLTWIMLIALFIDISLLQLWLIRNKKRSSCPHCGEPIPMKSFLKIYNNQCSDCGGKFYFDRTDSARSFFTYYLSFGVAPFLNMFMEISIWQLICFMVPTVIFAIVCIIPYTTYYEKDEGDLPPPLW